MRQIYIVSSYAKLGMEVAMLYLQFKSSSCFMLIISFLPPNKVRLQFDPRAEAATGALVSYAGGISTNMHILISCRLQSAMVIWPAGGQVQLMSSSN